MSCMTKQISNYDYVTILLNRVGELYKTGDIEGARKVLDRAVEFADDIEDIYRKTLAFIQIARAYLMVGMKDKAGELLSSIEEEITERSEDKLRIYIIAIRIERLKMNLIPSDKTYEYYEEIRQEFEKILNKEYGPSTMRQYIAFLVMMWAPYMIERNIELAQSVINGAIERLKMYREDPQYAELLTTLAEIHTKIDRIDEAIRELQQAINIYIKNLDEFQDTILAILKFVKENFPDKYEYFISELGEEISTIIGDDEQ